MKATITGATGLLGANLAIELLNQGVEVRCTRRGSSRIDHLKHYPITWVDADLSDQEGLTRAFEGSDAVFHCAAEISFRRRPTARMIDTNIEGTRRVIRAVQQAGVGRLIHTSSVVAIGMNPDGSPATETNPWNYDAFGLDEAYSLTKRDAQQVVLEAVRDEGLNAVIVNPCYMIGPVDPKPSSGRFLIAVVKREMPGMTGGCNNYVDVRDVCHGMYLAWKKGRTGECYILGGENMHYYQAVQRIAAVAGVRPPLLHIPRLFGNIAGWIGDLSERITGKEALVNSITIRYAYCTEYKFSSEKAIQELGYKARPLEDAARDALQWFREQGML